MVNFTSACFTLYNLPTVPFCEWTLKQPWNQPSVPSADITTLCGSNVILPRPVTCLGGPTQVYVPRCAYAIETNWMLLRVVTLVTGKLKRKWLCEVYFGIRD